MPRARRSGTGARLLAAALAAALVGCASTQDYFKDAGRAPAVAPASLAAWPHRELWSGIVFNGEKVGFTHRELRPAAGAPGRFELESEAALRLRFLGFDKRAVLRGVDRVRADLTLESFRYSHYIDGSRMEVEGRFDGKVLEITTTTSGGTKQETVSVDGPLYPSSALAMLPVVRGLAVGARGRYQVFNGETQSVAEAEQAIEAYETSELFEGAAFRVVTRLHGLETTTWIAADGRPLFELGLNGVLISALETEDAAKRYLLEASLSRRDALVDFSLLKAGPLAAPRQVSALEIALADFPKGFAVPGGGGQRCERRDGSLVCRIDRSAPPARDGDARRYLAPTLAAPSNLPEIRGLAARVTAGSRSPEESVGRLLRWIEANIEREAVDTFSAVDVLRERRAECQGHAYLLAALARAAGIPARIVNGIVYSEPHGGFLYHTWNELWIDGWRPVDATFAQPLADATHLKLVEGEAPVELMPLVGLIGKVRVASLRALARW